MLYFYKYLKRRVEKWQKIDLQSTPFEPSSKRKRGFPSESKVKRGLQIVHGEKVLEEKLGRNDPCPCLSGRRFQELLHEIRKVRWYQ